MRAVDQARAVVITGSGSVFSAGVDLQRIVAGGPSYVREFLPALSDSFMAIFDHPGPVVAAVNGHAIAGGCVIAAACDVRLMAHGKIGLAELSVSVPFPPVAMEIMRYAVGPGTSASRPQRPLTGSWWYSLRNSTTSRHCVSKSGWAATRRARAARVIGR